MASKPLLVTTLLKVPRAKKNSASGCSRCLHGIANLTSPRPGGIANVPSPIVRDFQANRWAENHLFSVTAKVGVGSDGIILRFNHANDRSATFRVCYITLSQTNRTTWLSSSITG